MPSTTWPTTTAAHVHWAYEPRSASNYKAVARRDEAPGGLLLLDLAVPLEGVYDRLAVLKGPSFGAEFTVASAQIFVAYFDLLSTEAGRAVCGLAACTVTW